MRSIVLAIVVFGLCPCGMAQEKDVPRLEVFGGYSVHVPAKDPRFATRDSRQGWVASATANLNRWFGIEAELGNHFGKERVPPGLLFPAASPPYPDYEIDTRLVSFFVGPKVTLRRERLSLFAHVRIGGINQKNDRTITAPEFTGSPFRASISDTAVALSAGGGADVQISKRIAIRVAQVDYVRARYDMASTGNGDTDPIYFRANNSPHSLRVSGGLVLRFGF